MTTEAGKRLLDDLAFAAPELWPLHIGRRMAEAVAAERARILPLMVTIKEALGIGAICFDGDSWFVSHDALGENGYDLDEAEAKLGAASAAVLAIIDGETP